MFWRALLKDYGSRAAEVAWLPQGFHLRSAKFSRRIVMDFLSQLLRGIAFVPALVNGIEGLFASKSGSEKKDAAMSFLQNALAMTDAVAAREIIAPDKFRDGISKIIDGTVECLNASTWCKQPPAQNGQPSA
jgi:hypothetical protein